MKNFQDEISETVFLLLFDKWLLQVWAREARPEKLTQRAGRKKTLGASLPPLPPIQPQRPMPVARTLPGAVVAGPRRATWAGFWNWVSDCMRQGKNISDDFRRISDTGTTRNRLISREGHLNLSELSTDR